MALPTTSKKTFLDLPRELRDIIYELTFTRTVDLSLSLPDINQSNGSLFLTSHQIHFETAELYYQRTHFYATNVDKTIAWIMALPPKFVNAIKTIRCSWRAAEVLNKLWRNGNRGLAKILSENKVLEEWRHVEGTWQWVATEWDPSEASWGVMPSAQATGIPRAIP